MRTRFEDLQFAAERLALGVRILATSDADLRSRLLRAGLEVMNVVHLGPRLEEPYQSRAARLLADLTAVIPGPAAHGPLDEKLRSRGPDDVVAITQSLFALEHDLRALLNERGAEAADGDRA